MRVRLHFVVIAESAGEPQIALETKFSSIVFLWDGEEMARAFGGDPSWVILDPMLRVVDVAPLDETDRVLSDLMRSTRPNPGFAPSLGPILSSTNVFEPELSAHLIACFERAGGRESGFMQDHGGRQSKLSTVVGNVGTISI